MKVFFLNLFLGFGAIHLMAQDSVNPILTFAKSITEEIINNPNMYDWGGYSKPTGGYLYRFYFDVTGDGREELFLGSSIKANRRAAIWSVFNLVNNAFITTNISFHPEAFYFKQTPSSSVITEVTGRPVDGGFNIYKYNFNPSGEFSTSSTFKEIKDAEIANFNYEEWLQSLNLGQLVTNRNIEKILLGVYAKNPKAQWTPYNREYALDHQYLDAADTNIIKEMGSFFPQEAQKLIEQWEKKENKNENQSINESVPPTTSLPTNNQNKQTTQITPINNWPLIGWIGLGAIVVGLVTYLLLKK